MDSCVSQWISVVGFTDHSNECEGCINGGEFYIALCCKHLVA
jgi:hypothetical protein